jgi:histidyl-tRNA synthetase
LQGGSHFGRYDPRVRLQSLPGFRDFYPAEMAVRRAIESAWHKASRAAGFEEWDGPVLEPLELFTAKSGAEIAGQLYWFADKGGRDVALRPEMTPTLARMIAARAGALPKPIKWYCVPQFFRYERPQRGRGREFYQWNVDVVGAAEPAADAEAIAVAIDGLRALGLAASDVVVRLNDRRFVAERLRSLDVADAVVPEVLGAIDKLARERSAADRLHALLGDARAKQVLEWCDSPPVASEGALGAVVAACADYGLADYVEPDFKVVRGLAYYTGPVWEIFARTGELRAVAGGGRYDELIAAAGGPDLPALGFGMGDMVLGELLATRGLVPKAAPRVDVFVVPIGDDMLTPARSVARRLRDRGIATEVPYTALRVGKALKAADQAGARRAVIVGPDEWKDGCVVERDLAAGTERRVSVEDLG